MAAPKKSESRQTGWLNQREAAASLGIAARNFAEWNIKPVAKIGRENFYTIRDILDNRLAKQIETLKASFEDVDLEGYDFEKYRLTKAQADGQEIKNEQARAKLVPIELMTMVLARVGSEWAALVDALPLNIKRKHPTLDSQMIEDIKRQCVRMQNAVARLDDIVDEVVADHAASIAAD